jgi:Domain of unknown function (DUF5602)
MLHYKIIAKGLVTVLLAVVATIALLGCAEFQKIGAKAGTYDGPSQAIGGSRAHAFVTLNTNGMPTAIGLRMSEAALVGLPAEPPRNADGWEYILSLPKEAANAGYNHIGIDWNPKGHIPPGIYDMPHFDFHFYLISQEQRGKITAVGEDLAKAHKSPAPEFMPVGYILPNGTEVPRMGAHAIDTTAPEFNKLPFTKTFIYGFYDGQMVFLEPMVTKAFLETKPNVTDPIRLPTTYSQHAYYPTHYCVKYNPAQREYVISLESLISK